MKLKILVVEKEVRCSSTIQSTLREPIQLRKKEIWEYYYRGLTEWADRYRVGLPKVPDNCDQSYHMFYLLMPNLAKRQELIIYLKARRIAAVFHYLPLHLTEMRPPIWRSPRNSSSHGRHQ